MRGCFPIFPRHAITTASLGALLIGCAVGKKVVYPTYGVHNPPEYSPCEHKDCVYVRQPGEPSDPLYPEYWSSRWVMYRVFNRYQEFPPPYDRKPPAELIEGQDYEVSHGATYYDSTWRGPSGQGAMMEHYEKRCLPIFPIDNHFTCSFISLGDTAYFLTYDEDRPQGMPPICLFSDLNHPPRRDFIKHLPYSAGDSARLDGQVQGYSFWVDQASGKVMQVGVSPDGTDKGWIMFGYGFMSTPAPDRVDTAAEPYRHPHSFYFSGYPAPPANAPIVSQNYIDFAMIRPDPAKTWDLVARMSGGEKIPRCQLFNPPKRQRSNALQAPKADEAPTWGDIAKKK